MNARLLSPCVGLPSFSDQSQKPSASAHTSAGTVASPSGRAARPQSTSPVPVQLGTVRAYLLTIARNLYRQERRQAWRAKEMPEHLAAPGNPEHITGARLQLERVALPESLQLLGADQVHAAGPVG